MSREERMRILLLGCGNVGANVARQLAARHPELDLLLGDLNLATAEKLAAQLGPRVRAVKADVLDPACLDTLFDGVELVFNAVGPFYRSAVPVIEAQANPALADEFGALDVKRRGKLDRADLAGWLTD